MVKEKEKVEQELEAEQEFLVNKLTKQNRAAVAAKENAERRLAALKAERDLIAAEASAAQVACTSLREKVTQAQSEKVALERRLENEQEYITMRLNKQLAAVRAEKDKLQNTQHAEAESLLAAISASIRRLRVESGSPSPSKPSPQPAAPSPDSIDDAGSGLDLLSKLESELAAIQKRFAQRSATHAAEAAASAEHDSEIQRLRTENWLLKQRISAAEESRAQITEQVAATTFADEIDSERAFNMGGTQDGFMQRSRAPSIDHTPPLSMHAPPHHGASDSGSISTSQAGSHRHSRSFGSEGMPGSNLDSLAAIARGLSGGPSAAMASPAPSSDAELTEDDEDSRFLRSGRNAHRVYPAEWSSPSPGVTRGRAASGASDSALRLPLPPSTGGAHPPLPLQGTAPNSAHNGQQLDMDAMLEGFPPGASSDRWRRSLGVEDELVVGGAEAAGGGGRQVADLEKPLAAFPGGVSGDASSVSGSVSGMSSVSDADKASAALVENGVEAIKAAMRRTDQ